MSTERDTRFKNFAELLRDELVHLDNDGYFDIGDPDKYCTAIAQRAYDLVLHTAYHISIRDLESLLMVEVAEKIPDMTSFPEQPQP